MNIYMTKATEDSLRELAAMWNLSYASTISLLVNKAFIDEAARRMEQERTRA